MTAVQKPSYLTAVFLGSSAFVFINFGLPIHADDLGLDAFSIGGMYAVFTGTMLVVRPIVGYCLDRYGRRWFFTGAFFFYAISMLALAASEGLLDFYLARFLQGIGASLMWVSVRTIVADINQPLDRGAAMGQLMAVSVRGSMLGAVYGFTLLGFMPLQQAWVFAFGGYALLAGIGGVWALLRVQESRVASPQAVFPRLHWTPALQKVLVIVFLTGFASALIEPIFLLYLKNKFELSTVALAVAFLPAGLAFAIIPKYAGRWSDRWGRAPVMAVGISFAGIVALVMPYWPSILLVAGSYVLFSIGWAMAGPAGDALVADLAPEGVMGRVIGAKEAAAGVGSALGPLVGGYIYEYVGQAMAFTANGLLLLCTAVLVLFWFNLGASARDGA